MRLERLGTVKGSHQNLFGFKMNVGVFKALSGKIGQE
jgi:hypothetical protein